MGSALPACDDLRCALPLPAQTDFLRCCLRCCQQLHGRHGSSVAIGSMGSGTSSFATCSGWLTHILAAARRPSPCCIHEQPACRICRLLPSDSQCPVTSCRCRAESGLLQMSTPRKPSSSYVHPCTHMLCIPDPSYRNAQQRRCRVGSRLAC